MQYHPFQHFIPNDKLAKNGLILAKICCDSLLFLIRSHFSIIAIAYIKVDDQAYNYKQLGLWQEPSVRPCDQTFPHPCYRIFKLRLQSL